MNNIAQRICLGTRPYIPPAVACIRQINCHRAFHVSTMSNNSVKKREGHIERTAKEPRADILHETKLSRVEQINERVRLFRLDLQSGPAQFFSGQWLDTFVPGIEKPGGFTIISPPSAAAATENSQEHPYLELAVQESPQNPQASWLWRPIDEILDSSIRVRIGGSFVFPPPLSSADESIQSIRKVVFVAGGVGINPLMSMLSHIAETQAQDVEVQMLHGNKLPAGGVSKILFLDRITRLFGQGRLRGQLRLFITPDGEGNDGLANKSETQSINGANVHLQAGRIGLDNLREAIEEDRETSLAYVCGPPAMTDEFVSVLKSESGLRMHASRVLSEKWW